MKEIEVKFRLDDPETLDTLINRIRDIGAEYEGELSQLDVWFDTPNQMLELRHAGLRLRRENGKATITLKHKQTADHNFRKAEEIEFEIGDFDKATILLEKLGFKESYRLKKIRRSWRVNNLGIVLDTVESLGTFLELEGAEEKIEECIKELRLDHLPRITKHYGQLYKESSSKAKS